MKKHVIPARVRDIQNLRKWSSGFAGRFPSSRELAENPSHWNWKIPFISSALIEGERAAADVQRECAQLLVDACAHLIKAKPPGRATLRVTCCIALPDMFSSELCIYLDEQYFLSHTSPARDAFGEVVALSDLSLAKEWRLDLPTGVLERGVRVNYPATDAQESFIGERWYFGEVAA